MSGRCRQTFQGKLQPKGIALRTKPANHADGDIGKIRVLAEAFARMHVGKVDLHKRQADGEQRIAQGYRGMGKGAGIDQDEAGTVMPGGMNAIHQYTFVIALQAIQANADLAGARHQVGVNAVESIGTIDAGFAGSQQVQVGAVQNENLGHYEGDFPDWAADRRTEPGGVQLAVTDRFRIMP